MLQLALGLTSAANDTSTEAADVSPRPRRLAWADLLARVFAIDVTVCRRCGGRMRILEVVSDPDDIARVLHGARAPPRQSGQSSASDSSSAHERPDMQAK